MVSLAQSLVSAASRPLAVRKRPDLSSKRQFYQGQSYWIVKEPIGLNYFRFQEEEYSILQMLDGHTSLDDIKQRYEQQFPPSQITVEEIARFIGSLFQSGLLMADVAGQGEQLIERRREKSRKQMMATLTNVLAIRFKGIDPERILNWLYPKVSWFFTTTALFVCLLMAASALLLVLVQFDAFQAKLPTFHDFFARKNWIWLAITLCVTKVLHEFGHGLSCKHFGGECHEMGVMFLVLTPCLYCNVSDSWMLPNKWHRAAIGAAGMYVEVVIATMCAFIWWFTEPGMLNFLCLSVMFVSSVSTILFNGNPLLRYDGYYILADILEIPNLRQKASSILSRKMAEWCLGLEEPEDPFLPQRNHALFALYTVAAVAYRWFILIAILLFLARVFEPYGLQFLGQAIAAFSLYGILIHPFWKLYKYLSMPGRLHNVKRARFFATVAVVGLVIATILFLPLPHHVMCPLEIQPYDAKQVYLEVAGTLDEIDVKPGQHVQQGDPLAKLSNSEIEYETVTIQGDREVLRQRMLSLQLERLQPGEAGQEAASSLRQVEKQYESLSERLAQQQLDLARLNLVAPVTGYVFPPPLASGRPTSEGMLPTWSGSPLDKENLGAFLKSSELLCQIGDPAKLEAVMVIDQSDRNFALEGQRVEIKLDHLPGHTFESTVERIATTELSESPRRLSDKAGGELLTEVDESGRERPLNASYQARALLPDPDGILRVGLCGQAKIHTAPRTIGFRIWRFLTQTFNFDI